MSRRRLKQFCAIVWVLLVGLVAPAPSQAATGSILFSPNRSEQIVDSTFDVSILLNTGGVAVNALELYLTFPADKIQVVTPTSGSSVLSFWVNGPTYSNQTGTLSFVGGLPNPGITTSAGVISTVTFRAKAAGSAVIKVLGHSKVLSNDGAGTPLAVTLGQALVTIKPAAPAGLTVSSSSHQDQAIWYAEPTFIASWPEIPGGSYSYIIDQFPTTIPDEIAESTTPMITKSVAADGRWYFHLRAAVNGVWGATTHFVFQVDTSPPAAFEIKPEFTSIEAGQRGLFRFVTTDAGSGIAYYEVRILSISAGNDQTTAFVETTSPYQTPALQSGSYRLIVRAYDAAHNFREAEVSFAVGGTAAGFGLTGASPLFISLIVISGLALAAILYLLFALYRSHTRPQRIARDLATLSRDIAQHRQEARRLEDIYRRTTASSSAAIKSELHSEEPRSERPATLE